MTDPPRLSPQMSSRRLIVLKFVREYLAAWGESPSVGEIAAAAGCSRDAARQSIARLVRSGKLDKRPGARGLSLPVVPERAKRTLPDVPVLDYRPPHDDRDNPS